MNLKLAENIKTFRKSRKLTQEQLAEALGVTVGAVYKWESRQSTPDIQLILEMADLFETSTDVLLGYEWREKGAGAALARIQRLHQEKQFDEAAVEAEKALKKFPNHFDLVYESALMYYDMGSIRWQEKPCRRSLALFDHACELLRQNSDPAISEPAIRRRMAQLHLWMGQTQEGLKLLKAHNICGINNAMIGMVLGDYLHDAGQAEQYLGQAFSTLLEDITSVMIGYANVFFQRKDFHAAGDCIQWLRNVLRGIQPQGQWMYADKYDCLLLKTMAEIHCCLDDPKTAKTYLKAALEKALAYDAVPPEEIHGTALFETMGIHDQPTYDTFGKTAMACISRGLEEDNHLDAPPYIFDLWKEVKQEVLPHETV